MTGTPTDAQRPAVLIVDDDLELCRDLAALLDMEGYAAEVATDGPAAIAALERTRFHVAILDIALQHIDGIHLARFIRRRRPDVRIAIHSGIAEADIRSRFSDYDEFLLKPVSMDALRATMARLTR